ncbi:MAG: 6-bladed beta-propeller, partial [Deltaproteobacteria bacterium]|nr:6-bladed beta-propeller [Deltaproteobacteria bacterium]
AGHIYVSDAAFDNIQVFNRRGDLLLVLGRGRKGPDRFCLPAGLSFDADNRLYVADSCGYGIKIFQYLGK